jgi:two-component system chemotaxis response regulator CheB
LQLNTSLDLEKGPGKGKARWRYMVRLLRCADCSLYTGSVELRQAVCSAAFISIHLRVLPMASALPSECQLPDQQTESLPSPQLFKVVALAASAGGVEALGDILAALPADFSAAIVIVQHRTAQEPFQLPEVLSRRTALRVEQAREGTALRPATVFIAPPDWHLLVNADSTLSLAQSAKLHFVRPSADRLFESLATSFKERAIAVVLTGAASDGSGGVPIIKKLGGVVIAQDTTTAAVPGMPQSAVATGAVDFVVPLHGIASLLEMLVAPECGAGSSRRSASRPRPCIPRVKAYNQASRSSDD